jgi:hypothetical protein
MEGDRYFHLTVNIPNSIQVILCLMEHLKQTIILSFLLDRSHNPILTLSHTQHLIKYLMHQIKHLMANLSQVMASKLFIPQLLGLLLQLLPNQDPLVISY